MLGALRAVNASRCRPPLDDDELERIAASVARYAPASELGAPAYTGPPRALVEVVKVFRRWLHLPDPGALYIALATVVANRLPGDPVWLLLVAASSSGKTEVLFALGELPEIEPAATLTEAALLSGVPRKDHAAGATGGLLRKIGAYGILTLKDFGSVLSMQRDARAGVLAALRECYDGSWDRPVGADGGKTLHWEGKLGLIAGVTTVVDRHHAVMDALGSRFAFYRIEVDERKKQTRRALEHVRRARGMRAELRDAVAGFFAGLELPAEDDVDRALTGADTERLVSLADFVTLARSPVERDAYSREIELVPGRGGARALRRDARVAARRAAADRPRRRDVLAARDEGRARLDAGAAAEGDRAPDRDAVDDDEGRRDHARAADDDGPENARGPRRARRRNARIGRRGKVGRVGAIARNAG